MLLYATNGRAERQSNRRGYLSLLKKEYNTETDLFLFVFQLDFRIFVEYRGWQRVQARLTFCHRLVPSVKTIGDDDMFLFEFFGYMVMFAVVLAIAGCSIVAFVVFGLSAIAFLVGGIAGIISRIYRFFKKIFAPEKKKSRRTSSPDNATTPAL